MATQGQGANQPQNQNLPLQPREFGRNIYEPLNFTKIVGYPHDIPYKAYKRLSKFNVEGVVIARDHLLNFWTVCTEMKVNDVEDVMMRLFVSTLEGNASKWYRKPSK